MRTIDPLQIFLETDNENNAPVTLFWRTSNGNDGTVAIFLGDR
jgi:hypothetical protein